MSFFIRKATIDDVVCTSVDMHDHTALTSMYRTLFYS